MAVNKVQVVISEFGNEVCDILGDAKACQRWLKDFHDGLLYCRTGRSAFADRLLAEAEAFVDGKRSAGSKGGKSRVARERAARKKNQDAPASRPLPGTSSGNGEALNDEGATAPAGRFFEARQAVPGAQPLSASGQPSTPAPVSAHGDAAEGGLLTPWYGPGTGETFDQEATRADARIREDRDASYTVRAQHPDGDAATREGAEAAISGFATSPSDIQNRPGKSADIAGGSPNHGGSERGAGGTAIDAVRRSPGAKVPEPRLRYGSAGNVLMTASEMAKLASEFGDVRQITEELSDYLLLHPNKYRSHYAALRNWCRRRIREGRNPDGTKMTQGDRLARHFAMREKEILDGKDAEEE